MGSPKDVWDIRPEDVERLTEKRDRLRTLLGYAVLAASSHNSQPWLFRVGDNHIDVFADRRRALPVVDPDDRELLISCGCAIFHVRVAMRRFGYRDECTLFPEGESTEDFLARIEAVDGYQPTENERSLCDAIIARRTNRRPFEKREPDEVVLAKLRDAAAIEGAWLRVFEKDYAKNAVADLIAEGDRIQASDKRFRRELSAWVHPNRSDSRDGIPGYAVGRGDWTSYLGPFLIRTFDWGRGQAARDRQLASGSPCLLAVGTEQDDVRAWITAGQALASVLLHAASMGLSTSYLNQPIEVAKLRVRLGNLAGRPGLPQMLLRMGYGPEVRPTPRRTVDEVLIENPITNA